MKFTVLSNENIALDVYKTVLRGDTGAINAPGQFVELQLPGFYLRRPISVCDVQNDELTLIYKVVGVGTDAMRQYENGFSLDVLTGLGNGFDASAECTRPLLVGGGVGVPPLYYLCKKLIENGKKPSVVLGFNNEKDVFYKDEFESLGVFVTVTTVDGTFGTKGFVTDVLADIEYDYTYACGPLPMLRALYNKTECDGEYSFEARMGCGFGACMGCSIMTKNGMKRVCKEGPVFKKGEIVWQI
ncbi:MAG: dihydroorotate dehydrogenase electron transfer subunit [Clostridia bacterium]|nr:dihydroorotate dehydrogenase electron transfer subunit [Clostridia bacterium]